MILKGKIRFRLRFRLGLGVVVMLGSGYGAGGIYYIRKSPYKVGYTNVCVFTEMLISHPVSY